MINSKKLFSVLLILTLLFSFRITAYADENNTLELNKTELSLGIGERYNLKCNTSEEDLSFASSNKNIVIASQTGRIMAKRPGTATITATAPDGKIAVCKITVKRPAKSISLNIKSAVIGVGESTVDLNSRVSSGWSQMRYYKSSNDKIATVNQNGIVTGKSNGKVTITCSTYNGKKAQCTITVKKAPKSIKITNKSSKMQIGATVLYKLNIKLSSNSASNKITFKSSDSKVAKIDSKGKITALKKGKTTISVELYNGLKDSFKLSVVNENNCLPLNKNATQISYEYKNVNKYIFGKTPQGRNLEAFIINPPNNKYKKTYVMTFAIHGFEDCYSRDGKILTEEANKLVEYYAKNPKKFKKYRLVIIPCLNPDGTIAGKNNQRACSTAFGRCTSKHIDMNRDFVKGRFKATESRSMKKLLNKYKPDVFTDFHGWYNETLGTSKMCTIFDEEMNLGQKKTGQYCSGSGYIYGYVHSTYNCPSVLVEYKSPEKVSHKQTYTAINRVISSYS